MVEAYIGLAVPGRPLRSLVAEDRSGGGVRDQTGPEPQWSALGPHDSGNPGFSAGTSGHDRRMNLQVDAPLRRQPAPLEESDGGFEPLIQAAPRLDLTKYCYYCPFPLPGRSVGAAAWANVRHHAAGSPRCAASPSRRPDGVRSAARAPTSAVAPSLGLVLGQRCSSGIAGTAGRT